MTLPALPPCDTPDGNCINAGACNTSGACIRPLIALRGALEALVAMYGPSTEYDHKAREAWKRAEDVLSENTNDHADPGPWQLLSALSAIDSQKIVAKRHGISAQYLCDILKGRREISAALADRMGYQRVVTFVKRRK